MAIRLTSLLLGMIKPLIRTTVGAVIGGLVVFFLVGMDYMWQTDKQFYFMDHRESIITFLMGGDVIGALVGLVWAISMTGRNKDREHH